MNRNETWIDNEGALRVNGTILGPSATSKIYTSNLTQGYSTGGDNAAIAVGKDYYDDIGITIDKEYIENVCRKIYGKIDVCKEKDETDDVIVPPMKGFIEI
jgi:hypothetical protein